MKQSDVKLEKMYKIDAHRSPRFSLCKVHQYGQTWVKVLNEDNWEQYGNLDIIKRYGTQVVLVVANDGATECYQVLVEGEVLTMQGRSWRSMVEVEQ